MKKIKTLSEVLIFTLVSAVLFDVLLIQPIPRQIGLTFRSTLTIFPVILVLAFLACRIQVPYLRPFLWALLFGCVIGPYSGLLNSGLSDQYALGGTVPWSDAFTLQLNTQRFLYGGTMGQSSALRPIAPVSYAAFLYLTNNNYAALYLVTAVLIALTILLCTECVSNHYGNIAGAMFFGYMFFYSRSRLGTFMTEPYAIITGLLSCFCLLTGIGQKKQGWMLLGFWMLSVSLNARPAAMFLFPALGLWYFFVFLKEHPRRYLFAGAALALMLGGFALNRFAQMMVYGEKNLPNRQAAEMVYGMCLGGKSWGEVTATPEMAALNDSENMIKDLADLCIPVLKEHPENILISLKMVLWDSLITSPFYGAFSFFNGNPERFGAPLRFVLMALWSCGIFLCFRKKENPRYSFLLLCAAGNFFSQFFCAPNTSNYLRLYAASAWVPALIYGALPECLYGSFFKSETNRFRSAVIPNGIIVALSGVFSLIAIAAPIFIRENPLSIPASSQNICPIGEEELLTSIDKGSFIYMDEHANLPHEHIPYVRLPFVRQHFHDTASVEMFPFTDAIESPTAIIRSIDLENYQDALIFAPLSIVEGKTGIVRFCGKYLDPPILRGDRFFIPTDAEFIE